MDRWQSRGEILRWWRSDVAGISQRELAARLAVGRTALTNWEQGNRSASIDLRRIDAVLEAGGVLAGLMWALGTPDGMEPARIWSHVYTGPSGPIWVWLRGAGPVIGVEGEWGAYRIEGEFESGPNGVLVTVGASIDESPVVVQLDAPGWVDFGRGELPDEVRWAAVVDGYDIVQPSTATGVIADLLTTNIARELEQSRTGTGVPFGYEALKPLESFVEEADRGGGQVRRAPWPALREGIDVIERSRFTRMRQARELSLADTVERLAAMTDTHVGKDTLRRFETGKGEPHDPLLPVALDHVLGGNGHLALAVISSGQGSGSVVFPRYWQAPVWLSFDGTVADAVVELEWGSWRRRIRGDLPLMVISHASMAPLRIVTEPGVQWTAGVGCRAGAIPINHGWSPTSVDKTHEALSTYQDVLHEAVRHASAHRRP